MWNVRQLWLVRKFLILGFAFPVAHENNLASVWFRALPTDFWCFRSLSDGSVQFRTANDAQMMLDKLFKWMTPSDVKL